MKRLIVILLSVLLVVQLASIPAFAQTINGTDSNYINYTAQLDVYTATTSYSFQYGSTSYTIKIDGYATKEHTTTGATYQVRIYKTGVSNISDSKSAGAYFRFISASCNYFAGSMKVCHLPQYDN